MALREITRAQVLTAIGEHEALYLAQLGGMTCCGKQQTYNMPGGLIRMNG